MKIKVEIDLSQMFASEFMEVHGSGYEAELVEDNSFLEAIKHSIRQDVVSQVLAEWRKSCAEGFGTEIRRAVEAMQDGFLSATLQALVEEKTIPGNRFSMEGEKVSIIDVMRTQLSRYFVDRNIDERLAKIARDHGEKMSAELKARYDMLFASQLVSKLNENGMLREDVAKLLLPPVSA